MKDRQREVRARSRAVAAAQHARSKSAGSPESLKEEDTPQIGSRPLRSQKSADQGQSHAQRQQRSSPQREPEAHASTESWHQPASSSHSMADTRWQLPTDKIGVVAGTRPARKAPVSHSNVDISRHSDLGHARLQRYWSALQKEKLHGGAAEGKMEQGWPRQEQRALCQACQEAVADGQLAEVVRLLQRPQLGQQVVDRDLAWHLVEDVASSQQAPLKGCVALLRALPPHGGSLYSVLLARVFEETGFRAERTGIIAAAMRGDARLAPADWDIRPWRQLLSIYGRLGDAEGAEAAFEHARGSGVWILADTTTVNYLLNALSRDSEKAFERFVELKDAGLEGDIVTYNTLLKACMRSANLPCARVIVAWIRERGLQGSEYTYNTMIKVASYAGDFERALAVLDDMETAGVAPTVAIWGSLLVACGKARQIESAIGLWKCMQQQGVKPSTDNCNALLTACLECQYNDRALALFQESQALGVQPDAVTFNLALKACEAPATSKLAPGLLRAAFELLRGMARQGVRPDARTYTTLLGLCAQAGDAPAALAVHEEVKASGLKPDTALLNALIRALGSGGLAQEAQGVFRTMVWGASRRRADQETYRLMTRICREAGLIKDALHAYRGMRSCGFKPNNTEWREVIAAAVEAAMSGDGAITAQEVAECLGLKEGQQVVDLHGLSGLEARAAVLCVLSFVQQRSAQGHPLEPRLTFITGIGRHSDPAQGPVLNETVRKLLNEELRLATDDADRPNPGCLVVNRQTLQKWLDSRRQREAVARQNSA